MMGQEMIVKIQAEETYFLRSVVLRERDGSIPCPFDGDGDQATIHVGLKVKGELYCIASFYEQLHENLSVISAVQLRGMATHPDHRRRGYGKELIRFAESYYRASGIEAIWCNARLIAVGFYSKLGFSIVSEAFDIDGIGTHYVMVKKLNP